MSTDEETPTAPRPKFAPPIDGLKPYVVEIWSWGKTQSWLEYAETSSEARSRFSRLGAAEYVQKVRRATPADLEALEG